MEEKLRAYLSSCFTVAVALNVDFCTLTIFFRRFCSDCAIIQKFRMFFNSYYISIHIGVELKSVMCK